MYSGETQNYKLPQYEEQDVLDPVADWNPAFETIDAEMYKANQGVKQFADQFQAAENFAREAAKSAEAAKLEAEKAANEVSGSITKIEDAVNEFNQLKLRVDGLEAMCAMLEKRIAALEERS